MASRWRRDGRLHELHPQVHALGHPSVPLEGRMVAALLYVGGGAVLSHGTAAWVWELTVEEPSVIEVSCRRRVQASAGLTVHRRRQLESTRHRRFPVTTVPQTLLDLAAAASIAAVRQALAEADYRGRLDVSAVTAITGRGRPGSRVLNEAVKRHLPRLALTRSRLERAFLSLCEAAGVRLPEVNARLEGWTADAVWRAERVVVELDGYDNHRTRAQIERDRRKELALRAAGFLVLRYTWRQVTREPELVIADLRAALSERAPGAPPPHLSCPAP